MRPITQHPALPLFLICTLLCGEGCSTVAQMRTTSRKNPSTDLAAFSIPAEPLARAASPETSDEDDILILPTLPTPLSHATCDKHDSTKTVVDSDPTPCNCQSAVSWSDDKSQFLCEFKSDLENLWSRENALILLGAGGVSIAMHETIDHDVAANTLRHPHRWGDGLHFFEAIGNPATHLAAVSGLYAYGLMKDDLEAHELSKSLFNTLAITDVSTILLKTATNTTRPDGDRGGFPSGHTSSSVAVATILDEYYGHTVGIPAYILAGLVAWERIDDRQHDLSDVVFGAALGYAIGRTVGTGHQARFCGMELEPFVDPTTGATGIGLERHY